MIVFTQVVETFFAYDRPGQFVSEDWVRKRFEIFLAYTWRSLRQQRVQNFQVFVQTGERHRALVDSFPWPEGAIICRGHGREAYLALPAADLLIITRIDSDDMFHRDCLAEVRKRLLEPRKKKGWPIYCWKTRLVWDRVNRYVLPDHPRTSSPFFTHIIPAELCRKNWPQFEAYHFRAHGSGGAGDLGALPLTRRRVCVLKHGLNHSILKRGQAWPVLKTEEDYRRWLGQLRLKNPSLEMVRDPARMAAMLEPFGIEPQEVRE